MSYEIISEIEARMKNTLDQDQMTDLHSALVQSISGSVFDSDTPVDNDALIDSFISSKRVEGCSERTLSYYRMILDTSLSSMDKPIRSVTSADIRSYLSNYQSARDVSKVTLDNIRRVLSSFFSWMEDEDIIFKSPVRRIHKVRTPKLVKSTYSDEILEILRDRCTTLRDLAIIDFLISTGVRVGELVRLNISDVDFEERECVVFGKGSKERIVYMDARTKVHLSNYLQSRDDDNEALFVSLLEPHKRLEISGVETRLRKLGCGLESCNVHPHKFRRTMATMAIGRGMPVEQVQKLLGHTKIDTTMEYAMVDQTNVKESHRRFMS